MRNIGNRLNYRRMRLSCFFYCLICLGTCITSDAQDTSRQHEEFRDTVAMFNQKEIRWKEETNGVKSFVLKGDPSKEGLFIELNLFPPNWKIAPHWHFTTEIITVLTGSIYEGIGPLFDEAKAKKIDAGGYIIMPAKQSHYAFTKATCVVQVQGYGPSERFFVAKDGK